MLKLVDKKENEITMDELADKYNDNKIIVLMVTKEGRGYKLTRVKANRKGYAFVSLWGHTWADGMHPNIKQAIAYNEVPDKHILIFDDLTEYVNFLEKPHLVTESGIIPVEEFKTEVLE